MLGLPEAIYEEYAHNNPVRTWLQGHNDTTAVLMDYKAEIKFVDLVVNNAFAVGDALRLQGPDAKTATVSCSIAPSFSLPSFHLYTQQ